MRNLKKFLALVLAMVMAMSLMITVNASDAEDYKDFSGVTEEFEEAVQVLTGMGIFKGDDNGNFNPGKALRRSEAAAIMYRLVTGDVKDERADLHVGVANFSDVNDDDWFAGYVGFCADKGIIKGRDDGRFDPHANVTGYEMLAMLLRAVGYGKNNEFTGDDWMIPTGSAATDLGILDNVKTTNYGTAKYLLREVRRDVVADLTFQTAAKVPTAEVSSLGQYTDYTWTDNGAGGLTVVPNPTLGEKKFGLTTNTGIVLGNQATGEDDTLVGFSADASGSTEVIKNDDGSYTYTSDNTDNATIGFDHSTGLDLFGHKVKVWYDNRGYEDGFDKAKLNGSNDIGGIKTYTMIDKAELAKYVYAEGADLSAAGGTASTAKLGAAAKDAGFTVQLDSGGGSATCANTTANISDRYSQFDTTLPDAATAAATAAAVSPVNMYYLVSNNSGKTVDVAVSLSAEVGKITELNLTAKDKYLTLGTSVTNVSKFTNATSVNNDRIYLSSLTEDSVKDIGALVCAWQVVGTSFTEANANALTGGAAANMDKVMYKTEKLKTSTKYVSSSTVSTETIDSAGSAAVGSVNFTDGTSMKLSGITRGDGTNSKIISCALPIIVNDTDANVATANATKPGHEGNLHAGVEYTVYEDVMGRFVSMTTGSGTKFIYGTFADFEIGALGTGTSRYAITGVGQDGAKIENHVLTAVELGGTMTKIEGAVNTTYNALTLTQKDYSVNSNQIIEGYNTGYMIDEDGNLYPYTGKKMDVNTTAADANGVATSKKWTIKASDVDLGVARVYNNEDNDAATPSGTIDGSDTVVSYMLTNNTKFYVVEGSGTATLKVTPYTGIKELLGNGSSVDIAYDTNDDQVVFWTEDEMYGTTKTDSNHTVAAVVLSDTNLTRWGAQNMYYNHSKTNSTGLVLPGATGVEQFELWNNGEKSTYFIDLAKSLKKDGTTAWATGNSNNVEADTFYTLTPCDEINGVTIYKAVGIQEETDLAYADGLNTGVAYNYITVNGLDHANLKKGSGDLIFNVGSANVCDVQFKEDSTQADTRNEITSIAELNNAISVMNTAQGAAIYTVQVAVVYDNADVATIYIISIT